MHNSTRTSLRGSRTYRDNCPSQDHKTPHYGTYTSCRSPLRSSPHRMADHRTDPASPGHRSTALSRWHTWPHSYTDTHPYSPVLTILHHRASRSSLLGSQANTDTFHPPQSIGRCSDNYTWTDSSCRTLKLDNDGYRSHYSSLLYSRTYLSKSGTCREKGDMNKYIYSLSQGIQVSSLQFRIVRVTFAGLVAVSAVQSIGAVSLRAIASLPSIQASTSTVRGVAHAIILTSALLRAILTEPIGLAVIQALGSHETRSTLTHSGNVIAIRSIVTIAHLLAVLPESTRWTAVGADVAYPPTRACTLASLCVALSIILTATLEETILSHRSFGALAIRTCPSGGTRTFARHVIARSSVLATTELLTLVSVLVLGATLFAVFAHESLVALARSCVGVANRIVLAQTLFCTVLAPLIQRTGLITLIASPSLVAGALVGCRTDSVHTILLAIGTALVLRFKESECEGFIRERSFNGITFIHSPGTAILLQVDFGSILHSGHILYHDPVPRTFETGRFKAPTGSAFLLCLLKCHRDRLDAPGVRERGI